MTKYKKRTVMLANKTTVCAICCGDVLIPFENVNLRLKRTLFTPTLGYNLISTGCLADNGIESHFRRHNVLLILETSGTSVGTGARDPETKMYVLPSPVLAPSFALATDDYGISETDIWHRQLAHMNWQDLSALHKYSNSVPKLPISSNICKACQLGKSHKLPYHGNFRKTARVVEVVHSGIVGNLEKSFPDGFVTYAHSWTIILDTSSLVFLDHGVI